MQTPLSIELQEFVDLAYAVAKRDHWNIGGFVSAVVSAWHDRPVRFTLTICPKAHTRQPLKMGALEKKNGKL